MKTPVYCEHKERDVYRDPDTGEVITQIIYCERNPEWYDRNADKYYCAEHTP